MKDFQMGKVLDDGRSSKFLLPVDAHVQTFGVGGIRGSGKSVCATNMAEEMCKNNLSWVAFDPVSVWWGLRADRNGKPGGYPVVVIGGKHGDLPLERNAGRRIAEAIAKEPLCMVIDVKQESKKFWHTFMTDLALGLRDQEPEQSRHIFIEEAPEFVPQKTRVDLTARCKEAVERLFRLGRNQGYGGTLIFQRPAIIDKDVMSQCENLIVLRTVGSHDYKALNEWLKAALGTDENQRERLKDLARLPSGRGYFWSPQWLGKFLSVQIRQRETFHPGETRKVGVGAKSVELSPVNEAVTRISRLLTKTVASVPSGKDQSKGPVPVMKPTRKPVYDSVDDLPVVNDLKAENEKLKKDLAATGARLREANQKLETVKTLLEPDYKKLRTVFEELGDGDGGGVVDRTIYEPWMAKAGKKGCKRMLEVLIDRPELSRVQLATLAGIGHKTGTYRTYLSWLRSNGLVEVEGDTVRLRGV